MVTQTTTTGAKKETTPWEVIVMGWLLLAYAGIFLFFYWPSVKRYLSRWIGEQPRGFWLKKALAIIGIIAIFAFSRAVSPHKCKYKYSWNNRVDAVSFCPDDSGSGPLKTPIGEGFGEFGISGIKGKGNIEGRVGGQRVMCLGKLQTQEFLGYDNKQGVCLLLD